MKTLKILVGVAFIIAISAFAIDKVSNPPTTGGYAVGDVATDFELKNIDDAMVSLANYKDAKGQDVLAFARTISETVWAKFGIRLENEVRLLGRNGLVEL